MKSTQSISHEIFKEAVRCRLRSPAASGRILSGGLDSSAIFGMARRLASEGAIGDQGVEPYSLIYTHPAADERTYIEDVVKMWGVKAYSICPDDWAPPPLTDQIRHVQDFPDFPNTSESGLLLALARERGSRVVLGGHGGDEWLTGDAAHCAESTPSIEISHAPTSDPRRPQGIQSLGRRRWRPRCGAMVPFPPDFPADSSTFQVPHQASREAGHPPLDLLRVCPEDRSQGETSAAFRAASIPDPGPRGDLWPDQKWVVRPRARNVGSPRIRYVPRGTLSIS